MANVLYVVFHGLVCLVDGGIQSHVDQGFKAYVLLDRDKAHRRMFGNFLAELDFKPPASGAPLDLSFSSELQPGGDPTVSLNTDLNPVVQLSGFPALTSNVIAVITLPRPNSIDYFLRGNIIPGALQDPGQRLQPPHSQISAVRIFTYNFTEPGKLFLQDSSGNHLWDCPPQLAQLPHNLNVAAFHVYNEPPQQLANADTHNEDEFNDSMTFLKANVSINAPAKVPPQIFPKPSGIQGWEIAALDVRNQVGTIQHMINLRMHATAGDPLGGGGGSQVCGGGNGVVPSTFAKHARRRKGVSDGARRDRSRTKAHR